MRISTTVVHAIYLMCLALASLVALTSYMSGASFEAVIGRSMLALVSGAFLGVMAILVLTPAPESLQQRRDNPAQAASAEAEKAKAGEDADDDVNADGAALEA